MDEHEYEEQQREYEERKRLLAQALSRMEKPRFPWSTVIPCLIGAAIGAALIVWGMLM